MKRLKSRSERAWELQAWERQEAKSNILGVEAKNYAECGYCKDTDREEKLSIPWDVWSKWNCISFAMGDKEWGAVCAIKDGAVASFALPQQEVTGVSCEFKEELGGNGIVHSHHNMGAFHSSQDDKHARNLYEYSIVLSNNNGCVATRRIKLPCGGYSYVAVKLTVTDIPDVDLSKITQASILNIHTVDYQSRGYDAWDKTDGAIDKGDDDSRVVHSAQESPCDRCSRSGSRSDCERCNAYDDDLCKSCVTVKCKTCPEMDNCTSTVLPFCEPCDGNGCGGCVKLKQYVANYPEDESEFDDILGKKGREKDVKIIP